MRVIIIEDETPAAQRLGRMLRNIDTQIEVVQVLDSVEAAVKYLQRVRQPGGNGDSPSTENIDLIFMDIQLADGLSFSIFDQVQLHTPVVFTTAFDHYTLKAFKVNSVDYLLKPIVEADLCQAVEKYRKLYPAVRQEWFDKIAQLMQEMMPSKYKERLLIKRGQQLHYLKTEATAYCHAEGKVCYATDFNGNHYILDNNLQQLEESLAPRQFYRVNRQLLVNVASIKKVHTWLGGRLKLELSPAAQADTIVSRERVTGFKEWLGQ